MLVGDYCARALDPVFLVKQKEEEDELEQIKALPAAAKKAKLPQIVPEERPELQLKPAEPTELPCNVFGTIDRCDGMACEHDGNCYSGCCALFVSGDQKRCMPLVGGDLCPIAIDVVETFQIMDSSMYGDQGFREVESKVEEQRTQQDVKDPETKHVDHPPIIEKDEHRYIQDVEHHTPQKTEHDLSFVDKTPISDHPSIKSQQ